MAHHSGIGKGIYSVGEASLLTRLSTRRIRNWLQGYQYRTKENEKRKVKPLFRSEWEPIDGNLALSFLDLVELLFVKTFLDHGVSPRTIRAAAREGVQEFDRDHPFCLKKFETDGRSILVRLEDEYRDEHLVDIVRKQAVFSAVFNPLLKQLKYDIISELAMEWRPPGHESVVVNPEYSFGAPMVKDCFIPTRVLAGPVEAGDSEEFVAKWYGVSSRDVRAAVAFEVSLAKAA